MNQFKIFKYVALLLFFSSIVQLNAQQARPAVLFEQFLPDDYPLEGRAMHFYNKYKNNTNVSEVYLVKVNADLFKEANVELKIEGASTTARQFKIKKRKSDNFSWFGTLDDNSGIFFTIMNGGVGSKFYLGNYAYTLFPVEGDVHFLIKYHSIDIGHCGNSLRDVSRNIKENLDRHTTQRHENDDDCTLRLLIAITTGAETAIATTLDMFAQLAVDENNLAYATSGVNFDAEIAVTMRTTYAEIDGDNFNTDLDNLAMGNGVLSAIDPMRDIYNSDIQILIRTHENDIWGLAFTNSDEFPANANNGFCVVSVTGVTDGRFSFAHELGHLVGANHDNFGGNPTSARAFISGTATDSWRTICGRTAAVTCNLLTSCRIQQFSNPAVNAPDGTPSGTATRDNVQQMNALRNAVLAYRPTDENLTVNAETIANEMISNHLANHTITTSGSVIANANSLVTLRAGETVTLSPGFHAQNGTALRAYIDNDPCEVLPELRENLPEDNLSESDEVSLKVFPNPFSGETTLEYELKQQGDVNITLFDSQGRLIQEVLNESDKEIGVYQKTLRVENLSNGIYMIKLQVNNSIKIERVTLMN